MHPEALMQLFDVPDRMDADAAGDGVAAQLARLSHAVTCIQVPVGKDVNEFYLNAGREAVQCWLEKLLAGV